MSPNLPRSSRQRYRTFVEDYKHKRLDESTDAKDGKKSIAEPAPPEKPEGTGDGKGLLRGRRKE